jgi:hypothetical protein
LAQYYYLVASFPMLFFDSERPPDMESFLALCGEHLSSRDLRVVQAAQDLGLQAEKVTCPALDSWRAWERALRNELVKLRAKQRGIDPEPYLREAPDVIAVTEVARAALAQEAPLGAEVLLERARWDYLDELETGHYFDLERVVIYYLRLQVLHRRALFQIETGTAAFQEIYRGITRPIREGVESSTGGESTNGTTA